MPTLDVKIIESLRVENLSMSASFLIRAAIELGLEYKIMAGKVIWVSNGKKFFYFKGTSLPANDMVAAIIASNKYLTRKLLKEAGIPTPKSISIRHMAAWEQGLTSSLKFPLVVKPVQASHANGATMKINTAKELKKAVAKAFAYIKKTKEGDRVLIEEFFEGDDLRLFVVGDEVVSTLMREPAYVIGDGVQSIKELIAEFNAPWRSNIKYDYPLCPIPIDTEVFRRLKIERMTLKTIPAKDQKVQLRWNANVSTGGRAIEVTERVSPEIKALALKCSKVLRLPITGLDLLCKDISSSDVSSRNVTVLEANDAPGIDMHHLPFAGEGKNVSRKILEYMFLQH